MLGSIVLYGVLGQVAKPLNQGVDPGLSYLFATLGVAIVGIIFVVRRTLVFRAEASLANEPDDSLSLNQWRTGYITTYALCEALGLFGLICSSWAEAYKRAFLITSAGLFYCSSSARINRKPKLVLNVATG